MSLIEPTSMLALGRVLTFGAKKYAPDNWKRVENGEKRYVAAILRHLLDYMVTDAPDEETGESHFAHILCCAMFAYWFEQRRKNGEKTD